MDMYRNWTSPEEEEEDLFAWRTGGQSSQGTSTSIWDDIAGRERPAAPHRRGIMERIIAPFEAPQQFLFKMTTEVDEDGFQVSDIWRSMVHSTNYFNPFSNQERIEEDDIRQILFGPDGADAQRTLGTSAINLGISLLYDPLWFVPVAGAARSAGMIGARTAGAISRVADPAMAMMDVLRVGSKATTRVAGNLLGKVIGPDEVTRLSTQIQQNLTRRYAGTAGGEIEALGRLDMNMKEWAGRAAQIYREGRKLSPKTQGLVTRMLESNAIYTSRYLPTVALRPKQRAEISSLLAEATANGIDHNLLWDVYSKANKLEMDIMDNLVRTQRVTLDESKELYGRHLRRMYTVFDDPTFGLEKIDRLVKMADPVAAQYMKDSYMFDRSALSKALKDSSSALADVFPTKGPRFRAGAPAAQNAASTTARQNAKAVSRAGVKDYFTRMPDGSREFDPDTFLTDFGYFINENPLATMDDALRHVTDDMFGGNITDPAFMDVMGNYLAKGRVEFQGIESWQNILEQGKAASGINFRPYRERVEKIAERQAIPEYIRKEVLGQPDSFMPGVINDAVIAAKEAEMTDLFDLLSGARRLSPELRENLLKNADNEPEILRLMMQENMTPDEIAQLTGQLNNRKDNFRDMFVRGDTAWSSAQRTDTHTYHLSETSNLGSLAGRYVTPGLAAHLENVNRMMDIGLSRPEGMWQFLGDKMAALTSNFKFMKIVADAGANFRDTVGSLLQIDAIGGVPFRAGNMSKAFATATDWMNGRSNTYTEAARRIGYNLMENGFTGAELQNIVGRETRRAMTQGKRTWSQEGLTLFERFQEGVGNMRDTAAGWYQFRENIIRSYVFTSKYDELAESMVRAGKDVLAPDAVESLARQAAAITDRALFNYADVPYMVEAARKYGIAPFLTFPFKAVPQLVDSLYGNPLRVLKYDRVINGWNDHWAGGPDAFAAEVQALPEHKRKAMVIRLPGEDKEGNPLYLDLSYFLPWYAVRDLAEDMIDPLGMFADPATDVEEQRGAIAGDTGMRSSIFTPLVVQLIQALGANQDGLGRPIVEATDDTDARFKKWGRYLYQFMAPPTFIGGTTADSVGRAMQAAARTSPEPMDWVNFIGTSIRTGFNRGEEDVLNRYRERPTTRALVGQEEGTLATLGNSLGSLFLNVSASDPRRQVRNERIATDMSNTELQRQIAQIRVNKNMPLERKRAEIERLREMIRANRNVARQNISTMRQ